MEEEGNAHKEPRIRFPSSGLFRGAAGSFSRRAFSTRFLSASRARALLNADDGHYSLSTQKVFSLLLLLFKYTQKQKCEGRGAPRVVGGPRARQPDSKRGTVDDDDDDVYTESKEEGYKYIPAGG